MKRLIIIFLVAAASIVHAQDSKTPPTLKGILLAQLHTTHDVKDWFVPVNVALQGLTAEQAKWTDGKGNHSIGQLTAHLIFWDLDQLYKFNKLPQPKFDGNNDETFNSFNADNWKATVQRIDSVMKAWEDAIEGSDDAKLQSWYNTIAHITTHNAYHIGQILYIRKLQGSWNPENGVK